jgi:hypothetical protein
MNTHPPESPPSPPADGPVRSWFRRTAAAWNRFWFTPRDPTLLGLVRIFGGLVALYTVASYSYDLQEFFGKDAWINLNDRMAVVREAPIEVEPLGGSPVRVPVMWKNDAEHKYWDEYLRKWKEPPPPPYPKDAAEAAEYDRLRTLWFGRVDPRAAGLPLPITPEQAAYVRRYIEKWGSVPPLPYPKNAAEEQSINDYIVKWKYDPRRAYTRGVPAWSVWFYVTDPDWMVVVHVTILVCVVLLMVGFCTRVTSVLAWAGSLSYMHRSSVQLYGLDTMLNIVLIYLMIGPSGAALSVDRLLGRWWAKARPRVIGRWRAFWGRFFGRTSAEVSALPPPPEAPVPSVGANLAIRLLQIHTCIVYLMAGLSKMLGASWWTWKADWRVLANFEYAPMNNAVYVWFLQTLCRNTFLKEVFLSFGTVFTLFFEICYIFLIWRPATRRVMLFMALVLHGFIGMLMGLVTFSAIMLVMNMAFLSAAEVRWLLWPFERRRPPEQAPAPAKPPLPKTAVRPAREVTPVGAGHVKRRQR